MEELERRIHTCKYEIRMAINKARLPLSMIDILLESIRAETLSIELATLKQDIVSQVQEMEPVPEEKGE